MLRGKRKSFDVSWHAFAKTPYIDESDLVVLGTMLIRVNDVDEKTETLKIPQGIKVVTKEAADNGTFRYDAEYRIKRMEIPASVTKIEEKAFRRLWGLNEVKVENIQGYQFLYLEKEAFGSLNYFGNFLRELKTKELGNISCYWDTGNIKFKQLRLEYYIGSCLNVCYDECIIYIPSKLKIREKFWDCINLEYMPHKQFYFSLNLEDYYNLMLEVSSLREQLQMATFLVTHLHGPLREKIILFFQEHINKAVDIAVKENDEAQLKLYAYFHLIDKEKGFRIRHGKYLIEKYQNRAGDYLKQLLSLLGTAFMKE